MSPSVASLVRSFSIAVVSLLAVRPAAAVDAPLRVDYSAAKSMAVHGFTGVEDVSRGLLALAAQGARVRLSDAETSGGLPSTNDVDVIAGCFRIDELSKSYYFIRQPVGIMPVDLYATPAVMKNLEGLTPDKWPKLRVAYVTGAFTLESRLRLWAAKHSTAFELVGCASAVAAREAVSKGLADAFAVQTHSCGLEKLLHIGDYPYHVAVSKAREREYLKIDAEAERLSVYEHELVDSVNVRAFGSQHVSRNFVRVAFFSELGLLQPDENMRYEGMAMDFLRKLRRAGGFKYHAVHCSYGNAIRYLEEGGIDLVAGVVHSGSRKEKIIFSRMPMGSIRHFLFVHRDSHFAGNESGGWNGMTIAVGPSTEAIRRLEAFLRDNGCICRFRRFDNSSDAVEAYFRNETDAVFALGSRRMFGEMQLASFPAEPVYVGIAADRPDLASAIDRAMDDILAAEPDFSDRIVRRHIPVDITFSARLTYEERKWVDHLKRDGVKIPVDITPLMEPIKGWKNGAPVGFVKALFDLISRESGLEFSFLEPTTSEEAKARMIRGDSMIWTDMAAVVDVLPKEYPRISHVRIPPVYTRRIAGPDFTPFKSRLAILAGDTAREAEYVRIGFDSSKFVPCASVPDCFRAIRAGRADCVLTSYSTAKLNIRNIEAEADLEIRSLNLWGFGPEFALVLNPIADPNLVSVLDKCLEGLSGNQLEAMSQRALADAFEHSGLTREQKAAIKGVGLLLALALAAVLVLSWLLRRLHRANVLAESASRAKSTFLFSMSHDIRTPMNAIMGYTAMAKSRADNPVAVGECISKIEIAGSHLLSLINQILEMSRIESGKVKLEMSEVDLHERTRAMAAITEASAMQKGLSFEVSVDNLPHPIVWTDTDRAAQIIQNVLGNAVKYTPAGGKISYTLEERPCEREGYSYYVATVADTGIGMSPEFLADIFSPFSRERTSTVSRIEGTGLGMSIVKRIVDLMGGTIEIESKQGVGTTVTVSVPMKWASGDAAAAKSESAAAIKPLSLKGRKTLLVEDNEMNREVARWMLTEQGLEVVEAVNGADAVEKFKMHRDSLDFILMDIQMPVMDGYAATKAIREIEALSQGGCRRPVPIVALSANAFEEDRRRSLEAGMDAHVAKPIKASALFDTLAEIL